MINRLAAKLRLPKVTQTRQVRCQGRSHVVSQTDGAAAIGRKEMAPTSFHLMIGARE